MIHNQGEKRGSIKRKKSSCSKRKKEKGVGEYGRKRHSFFRSGCVGRTLTKEGSRR